MISILPVTTTDNGLQRAFRGVADYVILHHLNAGHRGLAVCGASFGVGVTYVSAQLAREIATSGVNTLLVDANMHSPGIHNLFGRPAEEPGLQQLLRDDRRALQDLASDQGGNLWILCSGGTSGDASELLGGHQFRDLAEHCLRLFECVIFDTPPANRSPDACRVSGVLRHALIVARARETFADDVATLASEIRLAGGVVVGSILNGG